MLFSFDDFILSHIFLFVNTFFEFISNIFIFSFSLTEVDKYLHNLYLGVDFPDNLVATANFRESHS